MTGGGREDRRGQGGDFVGVRIGDIGGVSMCTGSGHYLYLNRFW